MSILVDENTRLCTSGITGREGTFHSLRNREYGTQVVAGVTPGKGGQDVEGIPVFNTFHDAVEKEGANTAMIFVPPRFAADSILEAEDAGIELIICITEGIPAHDELRVYNTLKKNGRSRLIGPNCPGILSPGKASVGIIPASFFSAGNVGVVSRSGTLTYQIGNVLAQSGFGNSSIVGIGGDPVPGTDFIDVIGMFQEDDETELIVMCGEIGGDAEERAADFIADHVTKPVIGYIAGFTAPEGKTMGHAGAIVSGSHGTAAAKAEALEAKGVRVGRTPTQVAETAVRRCPSAEPADTLGAMPEPSALDVRLAEIDRRLRTIQSGLAPAAEVPSAPLAFPGPTLVPPPATVPESRPSPGAAADADYLIAQLRDLVAGQQRWLASARELLAAHDGAPAAVGVSAGPFTGTEALRRFEQALASLPGVRDVTLREYAGEDRAVLDVHLFGPPIS
jgi:succinyl-CoA synthetase alpha subunit